jgi:uncharacterized membrane protein YraQ (UPF0718 family)
MKKNNDEVDAQLLAPVIGIFVLVLTQTIFNSLVQNIWINLTFGLVSSVILGFVIYLILRKQQ